MVFKSMKIFMECAMLKGQFWLMTYLAKGYSYLWYIYLGKLQRPHCDRTLRIFGFIGKLSPFMASYSGQWIILLYTDKYNEWWCWWGVCAMIKGWTAYYFELWSLCSNTDFVDIAMILAVGWRTIESKAYIIIVQPWRMWQICIWKKTDKWACSW